MESQSPSSSCKQCKENQSNLYITCDCARNLPPTHGPLTSEGKGEKGAKTDSVKSQSSESKPYRTAKTVIHDIVRIYESTPPRTMKYLALISSLILFFAVLSLVLAQRDEAAQSKYGMAFPIDESSSINKPDGRVAASLTIAATVAGVPGESGFPSAEESSRETSTVLPSTTVSSIGEENSTKPTDSDDDSGKGESSDLSSSLSGNDDEEKGENGDRNPRIVFIERLMGLHLSAPLRSAPGSEGNPLFSALNNNDFDKDSSESLGSPSSSPNSSSGNGSSTVTSPNVNEKEKETKNSLDKVNAKWASRMRKFTIPISSASGLSNSDSDSSDPINPLSEVGPNPMLRYAAAAMMSRLIAAAARAQMEAQAREAMTNTLIVRAEGKDKDEESDDETVPVIVATMRDERLVGPGRLPLPQAPPMYGRPMPTGRASSLIRPHLGPQPSNPLPSFTAHHAHHHVHQHPLASARSMPGGLPAMSQRTFISSPPPQGPTSASQIASSSHRGPLGPMVIQRRGGNERNTPPSASSGGNNPNVQPVLVMLAVPVNSAENVRSPINEQTSSSSNYPGYHSSPYVRSHVGPFYPTVPYSVPYVRPSYSPAPQPTYAVPVHVPVPVSYGPAPAPPAGAGYYPAQRPIYHYPVQRSMATAYSHPRPVIEVPVDVPYHVPVQVPVTMRSMAAHPHHVVSPPPPPPHPHHGPGFAYHHQPALVHPMSPSDQDPSGSDQDHIVLLYDAEIHHGEGGPGGPAGDDMDNSASDGPKSGGPTFIISRPPTGPSPSSSSPSMITPNKMKLWREIIATKQAAAAASSSQQGVRFIPITVASPEDQPSQSSSQSSPSPSASSTSSVHHQPSPSHSYPHHFIAQPNGPREQTAETIPQPAFIVLADQEEH